MFGNVGAVAQDRRARVAVAALFLTNGALFANLLPRYPEIKADLHLSNAVYGAAVAAFSGGALVAGLAAAALIRRYRSSRVAVVGTIGIAAFVVVAGLATTPLVLAAALFVAGASDAITDVAQNAHGLRLQRNYGRSIINSFHAVWAVGAILGGLMGAGAIALHIPRATHLAIAGVVFSAVVVIAYPYLLGGPDHDDHPSARSAGGPAAGIGGVRNAGGAGGDRDRRRDGRGRRKFLGHTVFARQPRRTRRGRGVRLRRAGRVHVRRAG